MMSVFRLFSIGEGGRKGGREREKKCEGGRVHCKHVRESQESARAI